MQHHGMDTALTLACYGLAAGAIGGWIGGSLAGLAGIGGGLVYVPVFFMFLKPAGFDISLAVFFSMLGVAATGLASSRAHWRLGHIDDDASKRLLPGLMLGACLGLMLTLHLPEATVLGGLALLDFWVAWDCSRTVRPVSGAVPLMLASLPIGYVSGSLGIGGGTMLTPLLRRVVPLRMAVGTSSFCGMLMAMAAVVLNLLLEHDWLQPLQRAWPFPAGAALGLFAALPAATRWSARLHAHMPESTLRPLLGSVFFLLAVLLTLAALRRI